MTAAAPAAGAPAAPVALAAALADELVLASRMLADLAYDLGSDAATLRRHMAGLQTIDHVTQMQLAIADLLRAGDDAADPITGVTLEDMAGRLRRATGGPSPAA